MSSPPNAAVLAANAIPVSEFLDSVASETVPLNSAFSYFFFSATPTEEETKEFLDEPVAALPPRVLALLPPMRLVFVPFLERQPVRHNGRRGSGAAISLSRPASAPALTYATHSAAEAETFLFAFEDRDAGEYHYRFFQFVAGLAADRWPEEIEKTYMDLIRQELRNNVHGEADELSWEKKIALLEKRPVGAKSAPHASNKGLRDYARQSFVDTLTLYLHGICCDLDVDTGPRQLATRHMRKRLELLADAFPPPSGYAVFPEELKK